MTKPVLKARTLVTEDGVPIDSVHLASDGDLAVVLAHGFTLSWQHGAVWKVANRLNRSVGVVAFDFRGHGRSGGKSTLGDREVRDLGVAVAYARELGYQRIATWVQQATLPRIGPGETEGGDAQEERAGAA